MKKMFFIVTGMIFTMALKGQFLEFEKSYKDPNRFNQCAASFIDDKMLVDVYSPVGKCKVDEAIKGTLTVHSVELNENTGVPIQQLEFNIAIKNERTNTMWMYNAKPITKVQIEDIIKQCDMDDKIYIILTTSKYALTHHDIEIVRGC